MYKQAKHCIHGPDVADPCLWPLADSTFLVSHILTIKQGFLLVICSFKHVGRKEISMTCMCGDVLGMHCQMNL
jgi:hypothetical protein